MISNKVIPLFLILFLISCGPRSPEDCRGRSELLTRKLIAELEQIQTESDLQAAQPRLRPLYIRYVDLMIKADKTLHVQELSQMEAQPLNGPLREELIRIYGLPGGRELMERAQEPALEKWALYEEKKSLKRSVCAS
jgi:hypothetical protein